MPKRHTLYLVGGGRSGGLGEEKRIIFPYLSASLPLTNSTEKKRQEAIPARSIPPSTPRPLFLHLPSQFCLLLFPPLPYLVRQVSDRVGRWSHGGATSCSSTHKKAANRALCIPTATLHYNRSAVIIGSVVQPSPILDRTGLLIYRWPLQNLACIAISYANKNRRFRKDVLLIYPKPIVCFSIEFNGIQIAVKLKFEKEGNICHGVVLGGE